jgi:CDGSH-type Zn-finger protein
MVGDLEVRGPDGAPLTHETRLTLCRFGLSHNQPFCDNSHRRRKWKSGPSTDPQPRPPAPRQHAGEQPTIVVARRDASLDVRGDLRLYHSDGREMVDAGQALLCRCGQSATKPFCDSSHARVGFRSLPAERPRFRLEAETPAAFAANPRVPDPRSAARGG